jgi:hypothetical protein
VTKFGAHPERQEYREVLLDDLCLRFGLDPRPELHQVREVSDRRAIASVPPRQAHRLYRGRLVSVVLPDSVQRRGCIEEMKEGMAVLRYLDDAAPWSKSTLDPDALALFATDFR